MYVAWKRAFPRKICTMGCIVKLKSVLFNFDSYSVFCSRISKFFISSSSIKSRTTNILTSVVLSFLFSSSFCFLFVCFCLLFCFVLFCFCCFFSFEGKMVNIFNFVVFYSVFSFSFSEFIRSGNAYAYCTFVTRGISQSIQMVLSLTRFLHIAWTIQMCPFVQTLIHVAIIRFYSSSTVVSFFPKTEDLPSKMLNRNQYGWIKVYINDIQLYELVGGAERVQWFCFAPRKIAGGEEFRGKMSNAATPNHTGLFWYLHGTFKMLKTLKRTSNLETWFISPFDIISIWFTILVHTLCDLI